MVADEKQTTNNKTMKQMCYFLYDTYGGEFDAEGGGGGDVQRGDLGAESILQLSCAMTSLAISWKIPHIPPSSLRTSIHIKHIGLALHVLIQPHLRDRVWTDLQGANFIVGSDALKRGERRGGHRPATTRKVLVLVHPYLSDRWSS